MDNYSEKIAQVIDSIGNIKEDKQLQHFVRILKADKTKLKKLILRAESLQDMTDEELDMEFMHTVTEVQAQLGGGSGSSAVVYLLSNGWFAYPKMTKRLFDYARGDLLFKQLKAFELDLEEKDFQVNDTWDMDKLEEEAQKKKQKNEESPEKKSVPHSNPEERLAEETEEAQEMLKTSIEAAQKAGEPIAGAAGGEEGKDTTTVRAQQWVPFDQTTPVHEPEKVFRLRDGVYLGSEYGASSKEVFDVLQIGAVINITNGDRKVPNHFAKDGVEYVNYELADQPGEDILVRGIREGVKKIDDWVQRDVRVLLHCSAGLSRSASVAVAWQMHSSSPNKPMSLRDAVEFVTERRGRKLQINPSFWMNLAVWERELFKLPAGTPPTMDFTPWWTEDFGRMGFDNERIEKALEVGDWIDFEKSFQYLLSG